MRVRNCCTNEADDGDRADCQRHQVERAANAELHGRQLDEAVAEGPVLSREVADVRVVEHDQREAAEDEHAGERDDEGRDADVGDPEALPGSDHRSDEQREQDRDEPRHAHVHREDSGDRPDERGDRSDRQVDVTGDDDEHHADREDQDVAVLNDQVRDVLRAQQDRVARARVDREDREQHEHRDQRDEDAVLADVGEDVSDRRVRAVLGRADVLRCRAVRRRASVQCSLLCLPRRFVRRLSGGLPWSCT